MAPFSESETYEHVLDFSILRAGGISLYWRPEFLAKDVEWLADRKYQICSFDCEMWKSSEAMHEGFKAVLAFPDYYGGNLNALNDCLSDLAVNDVGGTALVFRRFDAYAKGCGSRTMPSCGSEAAVVLDIAARASRNFLLTGKRFIALVQSNDPSLRFDSLGSISATWNRREWLNKNRGL